MKHENLKGWMRLEFQQTPVYVMPDTPDWLIPNQAGDDLLKRLKHVQNPAQAVEGYVSGIDGNKDLARIRAEQFISIFPKHPSNGYPGRGKILNLNRLEECWFHITDRCNLTCRHCLFSCSTKPGPSLAIDEIKKAFHDAYDLGARNFYITGGEPLIHPDFNAICRLLLATRNDTRLVILTNGLLVSKHLDFFKTLPADRLYLQISIDGNEKTHDRWRGKGSFARLMENLESIRGIKFHTTLAMAVHAENVSQMADIVDTAAKHSISEVHYLWLFVSGNAPRKAFVPPQTLFENLRIAYKRAEKAGVSIDNVRIMESQVFSTPGTRYDLGNAGWESLAVGPDGRVYPTPALIGQTKACCGHIRDGIETVWRTSPVLKELRSLSVATDETCLKNPLRYLIGGGDIDHSFYAGGSFTGHDPYVELYNQTALWLMTRRSPDLQFTPYPQILMKMGDRLLQCTHNGEGVAFTHSNCVLSFTGIRRAVGDFYSRAAQAPNLDVANPVCYPDEEIEHIPVPARVRSYGCGSPVLDAGIRAGDTVVDLGSGAGVECFIAAKKTGPDGRVIGIDMLDHMLARARGFLDAVAANLGYKNVAFKKGFLESLPVEDNSADVVISNCVINLSEDKRRTFAEIFRILKPGGRMVISDVVTDEMPSSRILNDERLRGECIAGAMLQPHLSAMIESAGFCAIRFLKRFFYRKVAGHSFYSLTYSAGKPLAEDDVVDVVYPGPYAGVITDDGKVLIRGVNTRMDRGSAERYNNEIFILDGEGNAGNIDAQNSCACCLPPDGGKSSSGSEPGIVADSSPVISIAQERLSTGCMRCGSPLVYLETDEKKRCTFCGRMLTANAVCEKGHFVCDECHGKDALEIVRNICLNTGETDMIALMNTIRSHPAMPLHGPEHHFAVPGVIVACYRNLGGSASRADIITAIDRGRSIPGGSCGFWGVCGAAAGVGIAYAILLNSNPVKPVFRRIVQQVAGAVINTVNTIEAARCCQRETWTSLIKAAELSGKYLPVKLHAEASTRCGQYHQNRECIGRNCEFFSKRKEECASMPEP